ncbi:MAG TPA: hypothetical protein VF510_07735 [Ktedonobacterales bacterium]
MPDIVVCRTRSSVLRAKLGASQFLPNLTLQPVIIRGTGHLLYSGSAGRVMSPFNPNCDVDRIALIYVTSVMLFALG